jgi:hypothetical protein
MWCWAKISDNCGVLRRSSALFDIPHASNKIFSWNGIHLYLFEIINDSNKDEVTWEAVSKN